MRKNLWTGLLGLGLAIPALCAEKTTKEGPKPDAAMMEAMKLAQPGEAHKAIAPLEGTWTASYQHKMKAEDAFAESEATSEHRWIFGGRFLKMEFKGDMGGQTMEGVDLLGYDNFKKEYQLASYNNMSTGIMTMPGRYDSKTKTFEFEGTFACAMTGEQEKWYRSQWRIDSDDQNAFTMWFKDADGKEFKSMEGIYTRAKQAKGQ